MSVVPAIFNGMSGNRAVNTIGNLPTMGFDNTGLTKPALKLNWTTTTQVENQTSLRLSVLLTNQGARSTMPCKGIASLGSFGGSHRVLRRPAIPQEGGMYPQQGYARGQKKGLATIAPEKSITLPLMPIADSFNAGLNSTLGQPASINA